MELKVKESKTNEWGFVEGFKKWSYLNKGYVEAVVGVTIAGNFTMPYVYRKDAFIPATVIEEEIGIEKYIKAKKPFYSLLSDGFIVRVRAGLNFLTGEMIPEKSCFEVYTVNTRIGRKDDKVAMMRVREVPENVVTLMEEKLIPGLAKCNGDREKFLKWRMEENSIEEKE